MVSNHKVLAFQYLIIKEINFKFRFKRGTVCSIFKLKAVRKARKR